MADTQRPPQEFSFRIRRYDPESGEAPYWDEHTIELAPHRSVLEAILQAKDRFDGSIGVRCSCRQAICGSCGIRVNGEPALACHTHLDAAKASAMKGELIIFKGPLKDNTGKVIYEAGKSSVQTDPALEGMNYLVEGVIGSAGGK